jgi:hypothetical protein
MTASLDSALRLLQLAETVDAETAVTPIRIQGLAGIVTDIADVV